MKTILEMANEYIGHEQEPDEGYEVSMRRKAFEDGFRKALFLTKMMREAQTERNNVRFQDFSTDSLYEEWCEDSYERQVKLENEMDNYIKEMGI